MLERDLPSRGSGRQQCKGSAGNLLRNLGRKKIDARRERTQRHLRTIALQSAHTIVDKAEMIGS
jgi:hypothetical protein